MSEDTPDDTNDKPPLRNILYVQVPPNMEQEIGGLTIDPDRLLPVEVEGPADSWDISELRWEMILAAMLKILAYAPDHDDADYYRQFVLAAKPSIIDELSETGVIKAKNGDFDVAEEIFRALVGLLPADPRVLMNLTLVLERRAEAYESLSNDTLGQHYLDAAFDGYKSLLAMDDLPPEVHLNAGNFYVKLNNYAKAREQFEIYTQVGDDRDHLTHAKSVIESIDSRNLMDELFKGAYDYIRMGREQDGIELIGRFIEKNPGVWNAWFLLGWAHRRLGDYVEGRKAFEKTLALGGDEPDTLNELAICLMELNDVVEAKKHLHRALEMEPENVKVISNLGVLAIKEEKKDDAAGFFRTVLELQPDDPIAKRYLDDLNRAE